MGFFLTPDKQMIPSGSQSAPGQLGVAFWLAVIWLGLVSVCAITADLLPLQAYDSMDWTSQAAPPGTRSPEAPGSPDHGSAREVVYLLGTDTMGRDILSRLVFGSRVSLAVGLAPAIIGLVAGGMLGMLAGFYRGRLDSCIMAAMDTILAFPGLVLLLAVTFYLGQQLPHIILALGFLTIPSFSRVARANTLALARQDFIQASRMSGHNDLYILIRDILPNIITSLTVYTLFVASYMIVAEGSLSFLGLSVAPPAPSWGGMVAEGKEVLDQAAHVSFFPAVVMFLTVLSFNLTGEALSAMINDKEGYL